MAYHQIRGNGQGLHFLNFPFGDTTYTKVFVGGLAWETQSESLHSYFEQFGEILEAVVITDKHTGRSKGYGFVTFRDPEAAKRACADPNILFMGGGRTVIWLRLGSPNHLPFQDICECQHLILEVLRLPEGRTLEARVIINQFLTVIKQDSPILPMGEL